MNKTKNSVSELTFEQALEELERIVKMLEQGGQSLDESIELYERGNSLRTHCEQKLKDAKLKVEKIVMKDGEVVTEPLKPQD